MGGVLHHISRRKRAKTKTGVGSGPTKTKILLDKALLVFAGMWPLANLPQALQVHITHNAAGLSLISWTAYVFFTIPWIIYGFVHKEKLIQYAYITNLILYSSVVWGILMYG